MLASTPDALPPLATAVRIASIRIAATSSMISTPSTSSASLRPICCSAKTLAMIIVLETDTIAPAKKLCWLDQPSARPVT